MVDAISQRVSSKDVSKNTSASFPSKLSQDTTKRVKCLLCSTQGSIHFFFFVLTKFYHAGRFTSPVRSLSNITDANIYDAIGVSVAEASYDEIVSIRVDSTWHSYLRFSELVAFILPSIVATWIYVRFITIIGGLESSAS